MKRSTSPAKLHSEISVTAGPRCSATKSGSSAETPNPSGSTLPPLYPAYQTQLSPDASIRVAPRRRRQNKAAAPSPNRPAATTAPVSSSWRTAACRVERDQEHVRTGPRLGAPTRSTAPTPPAAPQTEHRHARHVACASQLAGDAPSSSASRCRSSSTVTTVSISLAARSARAMALRATSTNRGFRAFRKSLVRSGQRAPLKIPFRV